MVLASTGYGGDLATGGPAPNKSPRVLLPPRGRTRRNAHSSDRSATADLGAAAAVTGDPTAAEYYGYMAVDALVQGLKAAGSSPTQASLINAMLQMHNYNGGGLYGTHSVSFALADRGKVSSADNCNWVTQDEGTTFKLVPGLDPICGQTVPGKSV